MIFEKTTFEIARENLRQTMRYMRYELHCTPEIILKQVEAILSAFLTEERIALENRNGQ